MAKESVFVDYDEAAGTVKALEDYSQSIESDWQEAKTRLAESISTESSQYTRDGSPAPIFQDVNTAVLELLERIGDRIEGITTRMGQDAEAIGQMSDQMVQVADDGARAVRSIDSDVTS